MTHMDKTNEKNYACIAKDVAQQYRLDDFQA